MDNEVIHFQVSFTRSIYLMMLTSWIFITYINVLKSLWEDPEGHWLSFSRYSKLGASSLCSWFRFFVNSFSMSMTSPWYTSGVGWASRNRRLTRFVVVVFFSKILFLVLNSFTGSKKKQGGRWAHSRELVWDHLGSI